MTKNMGRWGKDAWDALQASLGIDDVQGYEAPTKDEETGEIGERYVTNDRGDGWTELFRVTRKVPVPPPHHTLRIVGKHNTPAIYAMRTGRGVGFGVDLWIELVNGEKVKITERVAMLTGLDRRRGSGSIDMGHDGESAGFDPVDDVLYALLRAVGLPTDLWRPYKRYADDDIEDARRSRQHG